MRDFCDYLKNNLFYINNDTLDILGIKDTVMARGLLNSVGKIKAEMMPFVDKNKFIHFNPDPNNLYQKNCREIVDNILQYTGWQS